MFENIVTCKHYAFDKVKHLLGCTYMARELGFDLKEGHMRDMNTQCLSIQYAHLPSSLDLLSILTGIGTL